MGQLDILEVLEKSERPLAGSEIANALGENPKKIFNQLAKLLKFEEVKMVEIDRHKAQRCFKSYKKMRLYYRADIKISGKELSTLIDNLEDLAGEIIA